MRLSALYQIPEVSGALAMGIPWINHAEFFRKLAGTSAKSDAPARGNSLAAHGNAVGI
jgi:hypothetical protein